MHINAGALAGDLTINAGGGEVWLYRASETLEGWTLQPGQQEQREDGSVITRLDLQWCVWVTPAASANRDVARQAA